MNRNFYYTDEGITVSHELLDLPKDLQNLDLSKELLSTLLKQYEKMGVKQIDILANLDVGGYTWGKYGFVATNKKDIYKILDNAAKNVKDGNGSFSVIDPKGKVSTLTENDLDIAKNMFDEFYKVNGDDAEFPMNIIADKSYGKAMLLEMRWKGKLDLTNPKQLRIFKEYLRKRKS